MEKNQNKIRIKDQLAAAGISKPDIELATETSEILLDLLAGYPLDDRQKKSIKDLYEDAASDQLRAMER